MAHEDMELGAWNHMWEAEGEACEGVFVVRWEEPVSYSVLHRELVDPLTSDGGARKAALLKAAPDGAKTKEFIDLLEQLAVLPNSEAYYKSALVPSIHSRMAVLQLGTSKGVLLYDPMPFDDDEAVAFVKRLGDVAVVVVPSINRFRTLKRCKEHFPNALYIAPDSFRASHGDLASMIDVELPSAETPDVVDESMRQKLTMLLEANGISYHHIAPFMSELIVLHAPSKTLLTCDLVPNRAPATAQKDLEAPSPWYEALYATIQLKTGPNGLLPLHTCTDFGRLDVSRQNMLQAIKAVLQLPFERLCSRRAGVIEGADAAEDLLRRTWAWLDVGDSQLQVAA